MRNRKKDHELRPVCVACKGHVPYGRTPPYCSMKCEKRVEGYTEGWKRRLDLLAAKVDATTAWRPIPLDPIERIISSKPILILSDMHCPLHSKEWLAHAIACGIIWKCEWVILNGDVMDLNQISRHMGSYYRRKAELEDDFESCEAVLKVLCEYFPKIVWLSGNHCIQRLIQVFRGEVQAGRLLKVVGDHPNLKVTGRSFVDVNDDVRVAHPRQYSKIRGATPQKLAQRHRKHFATGHEHHSAMSASVDGEYQAVCVPAMVDTNLQDYVRNEMNDFAEPMNGFAAIFGNKIVAFDRFTVWSQWGLPEGPSK